MNIEELHDTLVTSYCGSIVKTDVAAVKQRYRSGDIREVIVVDEEGNFPSAVVVIAWSPSTDQESGILMAEPTTAIAERCGLERTVTAAAHVFEMARCGIIVLAHDPERLATLPAKWKAFSLPLDKLPDEAPCRAVWEPPTCFLQIVPGVDFDMK